MTTFVTSLLAQVWLIAPRGHRADGLRGELVVFSTNTTHAVVFRLRRLVAHQLVTQPPAQGPGAWGGSTTQAADLPFSQLVEVLPRWLATVHR